MKSAIALARDIRRLTEAHGDNAVVEGLASDLSAKKIKPEDFSIRALFEELVEDGRELVRMMGPQKSGGFSIMEAGDAVSTGHFANITGQIVYSKVLDRYMAEDFVFTKNIQTIPTEFNGEKIPGVADIGDQAQIVEEGQPYPLAGVTEDWIETPSTKKRGMIVPVTREAIFFDRTGLVLQRAGAVGESLGLNKEKRAIDCVIDENTTAHRYKWRGTVYATYQTSTPWDNVTASAALVDWTDIGEAELTLAGLLDPNTGEPIIIMATTLIVPPSLRATAWRALNTNNILQASGGFATSTVQHAESPSPIGKHEFSAGTYKVITSRLMDSRTATDTGWYLGDMSAFGYMQNWPLTVTQAPNNSEPEFTQDIVVRYKADERGAFAVLEPRKFTKCTVA
jgi:hypothetical protein